MLTCSVDITDKCHEEIRSRATWPANNVMDYRFVRT